MAPEKAYDGPVRLHSQEDVDNFGKNNYTTITGPLSITDKQSGEGGWHPITDLSPLKDLKSVHVLYVKQTNKLKNLTGLENLTIANYGGIVITENKSLTSLKGLENVKNLSDIVIVKNLILKDITSLSSYKGSVDRLFIGKNGLSDLRGLENINRARQLHIYNNEELLTLSGLTNLQSASYFYILDNKKLAHFCGLEYFITRGKINEKYSVSGNKLNPTLDALKNGECE